MYDGDRLTHVDDIYISIQDPHLRVANLLRSTEPSRLVVWNCVKALRTQHL